MGDFPNDENTTHVGRNTISKVYPSRKLYPGIPTTIKTMDVNITTIDYLRILIIEIGSTIILMVVEAQGI